ncbi:MAG: hypothetical protein K2W95_14105 [Candidatus Obscuribacterales bacterium]|nr:hypothetical protein [Candidatus Obscuribacterales bacterium]
MKLVNKNGRLALASDAATDAIAAPMHGDWGFNSGESSIAALIEDSPAPKRFQRSGERLKRETLTGMKSSATTISITDKWTRTCKSFQSQTIVEDMIFSVRFSVGMGRTGFLEQSTVRKEIVCWVYTILLIIFAVAMVVANIESTGAKSERLSVTSAASLTVPVAPQEPNGLPEQVPVVSQASSYGQAPFVLPEPTPAKSSEHSSDKPKQD